MRGTWLDLPRSRRKSELGIADIKRIEKRLMMQKRGIINIERDLADDGDDVFAMFIVVNLDIPRDQPAEGIDG